MTTHLVSADELTGRWPQLHAALERGERVQVMVAGQVAAELVQPVVPPVNGPARTQAAVAAIVRDMIADGAPPPADSPLWQFIPRAA
jgi:antitoxin (DNA-binding transcriptional repressor) of toxin-antitoxin stability system